MAFNGSGTFNRLYDWTDDRDASIPITASRMDGEDDGFAAGLSTCITKDGQTTTTAAIPFASGIQTDTVSEKTSANGVSVDSVVLQDGRVDWAKAANLASATTTDLSDITGNYVVVTGTTTITGLGTVAAGATRIVRFAASLTLTHDGTSLILPGGQNIQTVADDVAVFVSEGSGNWRCVNYQTSASARTPNPNRLINGDFRIAQQGTSFDSTTTPANSDDTYLLDQWVLLSDGNDIVDVTQQSTVFGNGRYSIRLDVETANKKFGIFQPLEARECAGLIGDTVTLSFDAFVSATTKLDNIKAAIVAWDGTADSITSDIVSAWGAEDTNPTLAANWTYENAPANLNVTDSAARYSISATVDTSNAKQIGVFIWSDVTDTTAGDFLHITDVKLEGFGTATSFVEPKYAEELLRAQRFYFQTVALSAFYPMGAAFAETTTSIRAYIPTPAEMRSTPSLSNVASYKGGGGTVTFNAATVITVHPNMVTWLDNSVSGAAADEAYVPVATALSSIILDARL